MTPEQKHLVQTSFEKVAPIADTAAALFYSRLFDLDPQLERLFRGSLEEQGRKLMHMLGLAMKGLNRPDELLPLLRTLGARHAGYGVEDRDYETVGQALLWTLEQGLGAEFTANVREAWIAVYDLLAETMKAGAREALVVPVAAAHEPTTGSGGDRKGWRGYFPAAAHQTAKKRETEMENENTYETLTGRFSTTIASILMLVAFLCVAASTSAKTLTVTGTGDTIGVDGVVTLREAITAANTNAASGDAAAGDPGLDVINFAINAGGVQTITLMSPLPGITEPVIIDGYSQKPCASNPMPCSQANTLAMGSDAVLLIELNGTNAGAGVVGLSIEGGGSTIRGLVINRFSGRGLQLIKLGNNVVAGNFIGTNAAGSVRFPNPNNVQGIYISCPNNVIGGATNAARNLISGNGTSSGGLGILIDTAAGTGNKVLGNYIGTNAAGTGNIANANVGMNLTTGSKSNIIGGVTAAERNLISGNTQAGITFSGDSSGNQVLGNYIGTKADGTAGGSMANGNGISFTGTASNNSIGGAQPGAGNLIAFNNSPGVAVGNLSVNNSILGNSITGNGVVVNYLGIELFEGSYGVTANDNDTGDSDNGANHLQNYPVITSVVSSGGATTIQGALDSAFNTQFRIEFFSNSACDATGFGEGKTYLGSTPATTNAAGKSMFSFTVPTAAVVGGFFTATATDPLGNTSEFSACASGLLLSPGTLQFSTNQVTRTENQGNFSLNVNRTNGSSGVVTVHYATADGSAKAPADYPASSGTITFADGETTKPISIPFIDDNLPEGTEVFSVALSSPGGGATLGNTTSAQLIITDNDLPTISINDPSVAEGNQGTTKLSFGIALSEPVNGDVLVNYATTAGGTATSGNDYQTVSGTVTFSAGQTLKQVDVLINGDTLGELDETVFVTLSNPQYATIVKAKGVGTIINDDGAPPPVVDLSQPSYAVAEQLGAVNITVTRSGDASAAAAVDYATVDGSAMQKSDYEISSGTIRFAPGETSKTISVLVNQDSYVEGAESFNVVLSNPSGAALGQSNATVTITDDVVETTTNPIDDPQSFVHTHYHDFLNREPDQSGLLFWTGQVTACGQDAACLESARLNVSAAYFLSIEFQQTGYLLHLFQKESFGSLPKYNSFMRDLQEVSQGVVVNAPGWQQKLADNQQQFAEAWVNRAAFKTAYDPMSNAEFVNTLYANAGVVPPQAERDGLVTALETATQTRASALLEVAANAAFRQQEQDSAFVLMQYFGYLRRDPDSGPDTDLSGYYFWLTKLNNFNGDYQQAEMVKAFLSSTEYRARFGQQ